MKIDCAHLIRKCLAIFICCSFTICTHAQETSKNGYLLSYHFIDKDSSFNAQELKLKSEFNSDVEGFEYMNKLPVLLASKGFPVASVDSFWVIESTTHVNIYLGIKYNWVQLSASGIDKKALEESGFRDKNFLNNPVNLSQIQFLQQRILNHYEKEGYPFASVYLDSVQINSDKIAALLRVDKGLLYHIDSIRVFGKVKISKKFFAALPVFTKWNYL